LDGRAAGAVWVSMLSIIPQMFGFLSAEFGGSWKIAEIGGRWQGVLSEQGRGCWPGLDGRAAGAVWVSILSIIAQKFGIRHVFGKRFRKIVETRSFGKGPWGQGLVPGRGTWLRWGSHGGRLGCRCFRGPPPLVVTALAVERPRLTPCLRTDEPLAQPPVRSNRFSGRKPTAEAVTTNRKGHG
jgi:hypothetical protein